MQLVKATPQGSWYVETDYRLAHYAHCFYIQLLRQLPKKQFGKNYSQADDVEIRGGFFKTFPDTWSDSNWAIDTTVRPALVSTKVTMYMHVQQDHDNYWSLFSMLHLCVDL